MNERALPSVTVVFDPRGSSMALGSAGIVATASAAVLATQQTIQPPPLAEHLHDVHQPMPFEELLLIGGVLVAIGAHRVGERVRYLKTLAEGEVEPGDGHDRRVMKLPWH